MNYFNFSCRSKSSGGAGLSSGGGGGGGGSGPGGGGGGVGGGGSRRTMSRTIARVMRTSQTPFRGAPGRTTTGGFDA